MTSDLKRFSINTLKFIILSFFVYVLLIFVWGEIAPKIFQKNLNTFTMNYGHTYSRLQEAKSSGEVDILILGSSHAYRGFDTRIFRSHQLKAFNLGSSAQTPIQTKVLVERYLDQLNPDTVIYEVYPWTFTIDGVESTYDLLNNDIIDLSSLEMVLKVNHVRAYNTLIYRSVSEFLNSKENRVQNRVIDKDTYVSGGFVEREMSYFSPSSYEYDQGQWDFKEEQFDAFYKVITILREKGVHIILVQAPINSEFYTKANNELFDARMKETAEYYNYNEMMNLSDSLHFYNDDHLNNSGVEIFNKALLRELNIAHKKK